MRFNRIQKNAPVVNLKQGRVEVGGEGRVEGGGGVARGLQRGAAVRKNSPFAFIRDAAGFLKKVFLTVLFFLPFSLFESKPSPAQVRIKGLLGSV